MLDTIIDDHAASVSNWLDRFESALAATDRKALENLFLPECYWRDALALTWQFETVSGPSQIAQRLTTAAGTARPRNFEIDRGHAVSQPVTRVDKDEVMRGSIVKTGPGDQLAG